MGNVIVGARGKFADLVPRLATPEVTEFSMSSAFIPEVEKVPFEATTRGGTPRPGDERLVRGGQCFRASRGRDIHAWMVWISR